MSIAGKILTIKGDIADAYTSCAAKGATMPEPDEQGADNLATTIESIPEATEWDITNGKTLEALAASETIPAQTFAKLTQTPGEVMRASATMPTSMRPDYWLATKKVGDNKYETVYLNWINGAGTTPIYTIQWHVDNDYH